MVDEANLRRKAQRFASILPENQKQGIKWLRLSPRIGKDEGTFVLLYEDISNSSIYDNWFETIEIAIKWAKDVYSIQPNDWKTIEDLRESGIIVIDEY